MQDRSSETGFVQQILGFNLVPRKNGTNRGNDTSLDDFSEMWYGVFLWAAASSLIFHLPAALLCISTLRQHKTARFMPIAILLMGVVGPVMGGVLTSKPTPRHVLQGVDLKGLAVGHQSRHVEVNTSRREGDPAGYLRQQQQTTSR